VISILDDTVGRHVEDVCECIVNVVGKPNILSIIMLGSGSRGELTYSLTDGLRIYGDYEFLIVTKNRSAKNSAKNLQMRLSELPKKWGVFNPEFHIDFGITTESTLRFLPKTLWTFETKTGGRVVYGRNFISNFPVVTAENNDLGFLQELVFVRLWNIVSNLPDVGKENREKELTINYLYARNILDVLTILLPHEGVLVCGYAKRMSRAEDILIGTAWEQDIPIFQHCTEVKLNEIPLEEARPDLGKKCIELYRKLMSHLFQVELTEGISPEVIGENIWRSESKLRRARRKYLELQHFLRFHRCHPAMYKILTSDYVRPRLISILTDMASIGVCFSRRETPSISIDDTIEKCERVIGLRVDHDLTGSSVNEKWNYLRLTLSPYINSWFFRRSSSYQN